MRPLFYLSLSAALILAGDARPAAPPLDQDGHDLVLLHKKRPYRIRLRLRAGGQSYQADWRRGIAKLFAFLDRDGDGLLSPEEAGRAPTPTQWKQLAADLASIEPDAPAPFKDISKGKAKVSLGDFEAFYRDSAGGPLQVSWAAPFAAAHHPVSRALWKRLDRNRDEKLSQSEVEKTRLRSVEQEDDRIAAGEIVGGSYGYMFDPGFGHDDVPKQLPFFSLQAGREYALARCLLQRYRKGHSGTLSRDDIGLPRDHFGELDRNGDGRLDVAELKRWPELPPDVELRVGLDAERPVQANAGHNKAIRLETTRNGVALFVEDAVVDLHVQLQRDERKNRLEPSAAGLFRELDQNGDGFLDAGELQRPPFSHIAWLRLADTNGDGKLSRAEFTAYSDLKKSLQVRVGYLHVVGAGRSLFQLLDRDGDGMLSPRERKYAWDRLGPYADKAGLLDRSRLPNVYQLVVGHVPLKQVLEPGKSTPALRLTPVRRGPRWFLKMDRNNDGDISPAEWLGSAEMFSLIDADGDGLIDVDEAWQAERKWRGKATQP